MALLFIVWYSWPLGFFCLISRSGNGWIHVFNGGRHSVQIFPSQQRKILRHIIAYFSINIRWHSQNVSSDSRKWLIKHLFPPSSCKKQINKQNSYLLLAFLQSGSVPELDMHESKHFLSGQFVHSEVKAKKICSPWLCHVRQTDLQ